MCSAAEADVPAGGNCALRQIYPHADEGKIRRISLWQRALLSPVIINQGESIPSIAHAVILEGVEMNYLWAFVIGGAICVVGQLLLA